MAGQAEDEAASRAYADSVTARLAAASRGGEGAGGEEDAAVEAEEAEARRAAAAAARAAAAASALAAWQATRGIGKDAGELARVPRGGRGSPTPLHALPPSLSHVPAAVPSIRGDYSLGTLLAPGAPARTPYAAPVTNGPQAAAAVAAARWALGVREALGAAAHAKGKTMRAGAGRPATFVENLGVLFGGARGARALLARSELFTGLAVGEGSGGEGGGEGGGGVLCIGGRDLTLAADGVGPLVGEDGGFLGYYHVLPSGALEPLPEGVLAALLGAPPAPAATAAAAAAPAAPEPPTALKPPMYLSSPPTPAALQVRVGYSFFKLPGARPRGCRYPGCGALFGSTGAAIRHLKLAHAESMLPLNVPSEADAWLGGYFREQGVREEHWLGKLKMVLNNKEQLAAAKRARVAAAASRL